jgi:hypothetical protein
METTFFKFETPLVGCRHYPDSPPKVGKYVRLVREPSNPYDTFAIAVCPLDSGAKYGHIPKDVAKLLAPIIDHYDISIIAKYGGEFDGFSGIIRITIASLDNAEDDHLARLFRKITKVEMAKY